jgi:surface antigen
MAGHLARRAFRLPSYSGSACARLRCKGAALTLLLALGLLNSGCAMSGSVNSLFGSSKDDPRAYAHAETTGSIGARTASTATSGLPPEADLAYARAAVADLLGRGATTASASWENPRTGARGTVTPIAAAYTQDGTTCRDFLASVVRGGAEAWLQGEACRASHGKWEVKSLRPWKRS